MNQYLKILNFEHYNYASCRFWGICQSHVIAFISHMIAFISYMITFHKWHDYSLNHMTAFMSHMISFISHIISINKSVEEVWRICGNLMDRHSRKETKSLIGTVGCVLSMLSVVMNGSCLQVSKASYRLLLGRTYYLHNLVNLKDTYISLNF